MAGFELSKWYADCTTEQGDAVILYHAVLRWRAVTLHYASLLTYRSGAEAKSLYLLRKCGEPVVASGEVAWKSPEWKVSGHWREIGSGHRETLFASRELGSLDWNCLAPRAKTCIQIGPQPKFEGWGYVEHLRLTVSPWKLPIQRLRWGRFVNATDSLVWIDWSGPYSKRLVFWNGEQVPADEIGDSTVTLASGAVLQLDRGVVLRDGLLGSTALKVIPSLDRIFPNSVLNMRECKWLSRASLQRAGHPDSIGMAIHEVVTWP